LITVSVKTNGDLAPINDSKIGAKEMKITCFLGVSYANQGSQRLTT
jgi:hypothetical protein